MLLSRWASLREKLIKIGAKVVSHGRSVTFQMAEVAVSRQMFQEILMLIARLRAPPRTSMTSAGIRCDRRRRTEVRVGSRPKARGCRQLDFIIYLDDMKRPQIIH